MKGFLTHEATSSSRAESLLTKARHSREAVGALRTGSRPSLAQKPPLVPASLTWQVQVLTLVYEALWNAPSPPPPPTRSSPTLPPVPPATSASSPLRKHVVHIPTSGPLHQRCRLLQIRPSPSYPYGYLPRRLRSNAASRPVRPSLTSPLEVKKETEVLPTLFLYLVFLR